MSYGFKQPYIDNRSRDGRNIIILADADYQSKDGTLYRMPRGATSDGASTPPILWEKFDKEWLPPFGSYWMAAVLHDCAFRDTLKVWKNGTWVWASLTEKQSNDLLLEAMESLGTHFITYTEIYEGVHYGGKSSFEADRKAGRQAFMQVLEAETITANSNPNRDAYDTSTGSNQRPGTEVSESFEYIHRTDGTQRIA